MLLSVRLATLPTRYWGLGWPHFAMRESLRGPAPRRRRRSRTFRTKKEAERYERSQHTALEQGLSVDPRAGKVTLEAWAGEWQRTVVHLRPSTRRIYAANLRNHIVPQLGNIELGKLAPSLLRAWLSGLTTKIGAHGKPLAAGSVAQACRTLNRVLVAAVDEELLGRNPLSGVSPPRVEPEPMRFLSHEERPRSPPPWILGTAPWS